MLDLVPIVSCLAIMFIIIGIGYVILPQYTKNSGIFKVTFKPGKDNKHLQGDNPFVIKSNKIILVPLLIVALLHVIVMLNMLLLNFRQMQSKTLITMLVIVLILLAILAVVIWGLNLKINIYCNGLVIKSFFYKKTLFFCDLDRLEINYFGSYKSNIMNSSRPSYRHLHHYYSIITQERKFIDLYPLLFGKIETIEDAITISNPYVDAIVQNPPRSVQY